MMPIWSVMSSSLLGELFIFGGFTTVGKIILNLVLSEVSCSSNSHFVDSNIFKSSGSPVICLSMIVNEWQETRPEKNVLSGILSTLRTGMSKNWFVIGTTHNISKPSSVSVPVLSKQTQSMEPDTFIVRGEMQ